MSRLRDLPIRRKLIVIGVATSSCALLLISIVFLITTFFMVRRSVHSDLIAQAAIVADNSTAALSFEDPFAATETLQALRAKRSIDVACVYGREGVLFADSRRSDAVPRCPVPAPPDLDQMTLDSVRVARPVMLGPRRIGTLYLLGNLDDLWQRMAIQSAAALGGLLLASLAAFLIARRLQELIAGPVVTLAQTAGAISTGGDYSLRAAKQGDDEVGSLVDAFNEMVGQVQRREAERTALLRREQEANRLKDEFLASLSHELRTPLNAILGWIQILRVTPPGGPTLERALASLERNARAQTRLIEDLLDVSRIISGKLHLNVAEVDFVAVVESAAEVIRPAALAKQITLTVVTACSGSSRVSGDADRLRQVVWNLLSNAVKFTPHGGGVDVAVSTPPGLCELVVRDNGIGISPEFLPHVFDRFRQADGSMTRQHGGLGLGLAIVREITLAHGGLVRVESVGAGEGSTFTLSLPSVSPAVAAAADRDAVRAPRLDSLSVLIVDDDPDARDIAGEALLAAGASIEVADGGEDALARCAERRFDVLVCDVAMPGRDGYGLLQEIRARHVHGRFTPAVAVSAFADREAATRALDAGYQRFVAKPYEFADLITAVNEVSRLNL
jgi:signal transduction histidine kinase/CheY-like chemotaxis protein